MSLEKLLIFGFSIAALAAVIGMATTMTTNREASVPPYKSKIQLMVEKTK